MIPSEPTRPYTLRAALVELRIESGKVGPVCPLAPALLVAQQCAARRRQARLLVAALAVAASLVLAVTFLSTASVRHDQQLQPPLGAITRPGPAPLPRSAESLLATAHQNRPVPRTSFHKRRHRSHPNAPEPVFLAIPYAPPFWETDRIDVYQVSLPRATVASYGLPLPPGSLNTAVRADLMVGSDGIARAVRFIP